MTDEGPTDLREVAMRAEVERSVLDELAEKEKATLDRDAAMQAVTFTAFVSVCLAILCLAAVLGAAVRLFGWVSGLY